MYTKTTTSATTCFVLATKVAGLIRVPGTLEGHSSARKAMLALGPSMGSRVLARVAANRANTESTQKFQTSHDGLKVSSGYDDKLNVRRFLILSWSNDIVVCK